MCSIWRVGRRRQRAGQAGVDVELHRGAIERLAVVELDALAHVQRPLRVVSVVVDGLDEQRRRLAVRGHGEQRVAHHLQHVAAARRARAVEGCPRVRRVGLEAVHQRAAFDRVRWVLRATLVRVGRRLGPVRRRRPIRPSSPRATTRWSAPTIRRPWSWRRRWLPTSRRWLCRRRRHTRPRPPRGRPPRARRAPSSSESYEALFPLCIRANDSPATSRSPERRPRHGNLTGPRHAVRTPPASGSAEGLATRRGSPRGLPPVAPPGEVGSMAAPPRSVAGRR